MEMARLAVTGKRRSRVDKTHEGCRGLPQACEQHQFLVQQNDPIPLPEMHARPKQPGSSLYVLRMATKQG